MDHRHCDEMLAIWIRIEWEEQRARELWAFVRSIATVRAYATDRVATALDRLFGAYVVGLRETKGAGRVTP